MRTTASAPTATRYIGNCQICEADQKLHQERMVHHGYRRPGHGSIVGDCPGVGEVPYEVSCDLVKSYKANVESQLVGLRKHLATLKASKVGYLTEMKHVGGWGRMGQNVIIEYIAGVTEPYHWAQAVQHATFEVESNIRQCEHEIDRCTRRINAWSRKPIRTVEEEQRKTDADKEGRKALRDAARAARGAKKAAYKAKQDALAAKRTAIRQNFEDQFRALAASPQPLWERQKVARDMLAETQKKKYSNWLWLHHLECEDAFVALGLATTTTDGQLNWRGRPYLRWL